MSNGFNPHFDGRLNLEQQKKRAKELLRQFQLAEPGAIERFQAYHPQAQRHPQVDNTTFAPRLSDAQLVIARENGLPSWARLKAHIEQLNQARWAIEHGEAIALDADLKTLHIRCGFDIQHKLKLAGFVGDFLEFADPYCQGPVISDTDFSQFLQYRATFIASAYHIAPNDAQARLEREYRQLRESHTYPRVVVWLEHDPYDQLTLAYLLHHFSSIPVRPRQLDLICINAFPGIQPFIGLGQLSPEALRTLWQQRQPITPTQLKWGNRIWYALTHSSPEVLNQLAIANPPELPFMARALSRHLQELPWLDDGLSLTQRLTLEILAEHGALIGRQLFQIFTVEKDPLPYLGDTMYWHGVASLIQSPHPAIETVPPETASTSDPLPWTTQIFKLNATGQDLLNHQAHWLRLNPIDRWVGGVHLWFDQNADEPMWGWDGRSSTVAKFAW